MLQKVSKGNQSSKAKQEVIEKYCECGLPVMKGKQMCETCEGKNSVHIEGEILKKQKKGGVIKGYWFILLGKELYCKF